VVYSFSQVKSIGKRRICQPVSRRWEKAVNGEWEMEGRVSRMIVTLEFSCSFYDMATIHDIMTYKIGQMTYIIGQMPSGS